MKKMWLTVGDMDKMVVNEEWLTSWLIWFLTLPTHPHPSPFPYPSNLNTPPFPSPSHPSFPSPSHHLPLRLTAHIPSPSQSPFPSPLPLILPPSTLRSSPLPLSSPSPFPPPPTISVVGRQQPSEGALGGAPGRVVDVVARAVDAAVAGQLARLVPGQVGGTVASDAGFVGVNQRETVEDGVPGQTVAVTGGVIVTLESRVYI